MKKVFMFALSIVMTLVISIPSFAQDESSEWVGEPCFSNFDCGWLTEYCQKPVGFCDGEGVCAWRPEACTWLWDPVCGCDSITYSNSCWAASYGVSIDYFGECREPCECDLNNDGACDMEDWLLFGVGWGRTDCNVPGLDPCKCDLNNDGRCDMEDWLLFGEDWGRTDCPVYPRIEEYSNSGCLPGSAIDSSGDQYPWCGSDEIDVFVEGHRIHVTHRSATYNCCPDDIKVSLSVEDNLLRLLEKEILTHPCNCLCCYDIKTSIVGLLPGVYTLEYCWDDYETGAECYMDEIVIP